MLYNDFSDIKICLCSITTTFLLVVNTIVINIDSMKSTFIENWKDKNIYYAVAGSFFCLHFKISYF